MGRRVCVFVLTFLAAVPVLRTRGLAQEALTADSRVSFRPISLRIEESPLAKAPEDLMAMLLSATSADAQRVAYRSRIGDDVAVFVNGKGGNVYDAIPQGPLISPANTGHVAYVARRSGQDIVVVDGVESRPYDAVLEGSLVFSPHGERIAFAAGRRGQWNAIAAEVADGLLKETRCGHVCAAISPAGFIFSPSGKRLAFAAQQEAGWVLVTDGKQSRHYEWIADVEFHPDDEILVYAAQQNGRCSVFRKDTEEQEVVGGPYEEVANVVISPNGRWIACWVKRDKRWRVVAVPTDGRRRSTRAAFDGYGAGTLVFSPDAKRLAFVGVRAEKAVVVVNGTEYGPYDAILEGTPVFSPDSQRFAYAVSRQGTWRIVIDGEEGKAAYGMVKERSVQFTPDSQHLVYVASYGNKGKSMAIAVDDELSNDYLFPLDSKIVFDAPQSFRTVAVVGNVLPGEGGRKARLENGQFVRVNVQIRTE
jgi:WD40 repeat protein